MRCVTKYKNTANVTDGVITILADSVSAFDPVPVLPSASLVAGEYDLTTNNVLNNDIYFD
jgi:hypothetical protein